MKSAKEENRILEEAKLTSEITLSGNQYIFDDPDDFIANLEEDV